ncbi:hypothetical protein K1T71_006572 [Dendrolimus kikuchii]|uniref:Uncharacterized protein n=1 Tax=Dendrolimus kikuchii TaxID=765133 RepID=A0ACC1D1U2_9NEOP|nr:hypothetical protein K1T71_006572 [Dendrolimus kikuchii]
MPLIEGVGDEVIQFVVVVFVTIVAALAWWSTNARPDRYRTMLVMRSGDRHPATVNIRTRSLMVTNAPVGGTIRTSTSNPTGANTSRMTEEAPRENARVIPLQEMDSIVDADMAMLDNNRLHFYRRIDSPSIMQNGAESTSDEGEMQEESELASNAQIREMDSIVSAMEADVTAGCGFCTRASEPNTEVNKDNATSSNTIEENEDGASAESSNIVTDQNRRKILIKLKYLNDTLKEVEGSLDELLKDFKRRHFSTELSSECRVRLIFNGRVLVDEAATLRACGLHDRAVVHCLVHPRATGDRHRAAVREGEGPGAAAAEAVSARAQPERSWDLENILMTLVSVALTVVWFFRCEYSNMFTASASVALFGLTVFYSVAIFGLYLSDTFQFHRPPQPVPNN